MTHDCPSCDRCFESKNGLHVHHTKSHGRPINHFNLTESRRNGKIGPALVCPSCEEGFFTNRSVSVHHKKVHGESIAGVEVECHNCGEAFYKKPARIKRSERLYCSVECKNEWRVGEFTGENATNWKDATRELECSQCGVQFRRYESRITSENAFCSRECLDEWNTRTGRGGKWSVSHGLLWEQQRKRAFKRDSHECQDCGMSNAEHQKKHSTSLHVHHKKPARLFGDAENAHQLSNLVVLCNSCHKKRETEIEKKYEKRGEQPTLLGVLKL